MSIPEAAMAEIAARRARWNTWHALHHDEATGGPLLTDRYCYDCVYKITRVWDEGLFEFLWAYAEKLEREIPAWKRRT